MWHAALKAPTVAADLEAAGFKIRSQIIWHKQHFALSRGDYHWGHEPAWYAVRGKGQWRGDRRQTTVWDVAHLNPMGGTRVADNAVTGHGTQKPVRLFEIPITNHTVPGDAIYDPFCGSGTAIIAAEKLGRACTGKTPARWTAPVLSPSRLTVRPSFRIVRPENDGSAIAEYS